MGNTCQKVSQGQGEEFSSKNKRASTRKKLRNNDIINVKYDNSFQPELSPMQSDMSSLFDDQSEYSYSLHGIGIEKNPFYLSPTNSMSSASTASTYQHDSLTENSIRKSSLLNKAIGQPMLPPLEQSFEDDESEAALSNRDLPPRPERQNQEGMTQGQDTKNSRTNIPKSDNDEYIQELMEEMEDVERDGSLDQIPNKNNAVKNFRSVLNKKVQDKIPRQGKNFRFPTPPKLRLPSALKRRSQGSKHEDPLIDAHTHENFEHNDAASISSYQEPEIETPQKEEDHLEQNMKQLQISPLLPLPSPAEVEETPNNYDKNKAEACDDMGSSNLMSSSIDKRSGDKRSIVDNEEIESVCFTEASSFDFFDQIMATDVPESTQRSPKKAMNSDGKPKDLELLFEEVSNDESIDLLSKADNSVSKSVHEQEELASQVDHLPSEVDFENTEVLSPNPMNISDFSAYEKIHERGPFTRLYSFSKLQQISMKPESNINGRENHIEKDVVGEIKDKLWTVKKLLTPTSATKDYNFNDNKKNKNTTPIVKNKKGNGKRLNLSPRKASMMKSMPSQKSFRAVKKAMSPKKHSYRRPFLRKQNSSSRMVLTAESAATNVKERISELNVKLMRTKDMRKNIIGRSKVLSPRVLGSNRGILVQPVNRNYGSANTIRRDKGAAIVMKNEGVWTNYSLDGAGPVWKRKEEGKENIQDDARRQSIARKDRRSTGHWTNYSLDGAGSVWKKKDEFDERARFHKVGTIKEESMKINLYNGPAGISCTDKDDKTALARNSLDNTSAVNRKDNTGELIEYLGVHPCLSDMSPLTISSSEVFRGRNEKILDMLKSRSTQNELNEEESLKAKPQSRFIARIPDDNSTQKQKEISPEPDVVTRSSADENSQSIIPTDLESVEELENASADFSEKSKWTAEEEMNNLTDISEEYSSMDDNVTSSSLDKDNSTQEDRTSIVDEYSLVTEENSNENTELFGNDISDDEESDIFSLSEIEGNSSMIFTPTSSGILDSSVIAEESQISESKNEQEHGPIDKENQPEDDMKFSSVTNAKVNPHQQNRHKGPPSGLCLSPVQRTPMQARKWRDLAAAAAAKDNTTGKKKKTGTKKKKMRKAMGNILNDVNV